MNREMNAVYNHIPLRLHFDVVDKNEENRLIAVSESVDSIDLIFNDVVEENIALKIVDICVQQAHSEKHRGNLIEAHIHYSPIRSQIVANGTEFGAIKFLMRSELDKTSQGAELCFEMREPPSENSSSQNDKNVNDNVVYVATDGSVNRFFKGGSYGWIASNGEYGYGFIPRSSSNPLLYELYAISNMLSEIKTKSKICILVDNRLAIKLAKDAEFAANSKITLQEKKVAQYIHKKLAGKSHISFSWVKAHNGHPLNEGADRLARNVRLGSSFEQDKSKMKEIAINIVNDTSKSYLDYNQKVV